MAMIPEVLREQARNSELIVFVGAGVSRNSSVVLKDGCKVVCPEGWWGLLDKIAVNLGLVDGDGNVLDPEYGQLVNSLTPLDVAEYLSFVAKKHGVDRDIRSWIKKCVEEPEAGKFFEPNEWHDALLNLGEYGPRVTVTTNYDRLLERKFGTDGFAAYNYSAKNMNTILTAKERPIFKLHGSIEDRANRLIISSSYYQWLEHEGRLMLDALRSLLMTRTALFVGYGLGDPDVNHILSSIFTEHHGSVEEASHFILHEDSSEFVYRKEMLKEWYGVQSLSYEVTKGGDHSRGLDMLWEIGG